MEMHLALLDRTRNILQLMSLKLGRHLVIRLERVQKINVIAPVIRPRNHAHAAVVHVHVIERDPGGDLFGHGRENRPVRRVLMPHIHAADACGLVLNLVVPQANFRSVSELGNHGHDLWMRD